MEDMTFSSGKGDAGIVKKQFLTMKLFFFSVQISPVITLIVMTYVVRAGHFTPPDVEMIRNLYIYLPYIFMFIGVGASIVILATAWRKVGAEENFLEALRKYFVLMVLALATCEAAAVVCAISILFGNSLTQIIVPFVVSITAKWLHFPGKERLETMYNEGRRRYLQEQRLGM